MCIDGIDGVVDVEGASSSKPLSYDMFSFDFENVFHRLFSPNVQNEFFSPVDQIFGNFELKQMNPDDLHSMD